MRFAFPFPFTFPCRRYFSTSKSYYKRHCCKLLVVGGGTGGCSVSARFAKKLCKNEIIVLEPCNIHYNQGMFTLIGGGLKKLRDACKPMIQVLHHNVTWFKDAVDVFCPQSNMVITKNNDCIEYDFMLIAMGLKLNFDEVCNLREALDNYNNVTTIHSPEYVQKTFKSLRQFVSGNALFTHPFGPSKCPAASLIVCFLAEHYFRKEEKRCDAQMQFASGFRTVFPEQKYAKVLMDLAKRRHIDMYMCTNLIEVIPHEQKAVFECLEVPGKQICLDYSLLHVTPHMGPPDELRNCTEITDRDGFVDVHADTLQHKKFPNVFAIGDCAGTKNIKTASAIAAQAPVVYRNLSACFNGEDPKSKYDGYSGCPYLTSYGTGVLAEIGYNNKPLETFPFRQDVESSFVYYLTRDVLPQVYWSGMLNGSWDGPERFRKILHLKYTVSNLREALDYYPNVTTIYSPRYVEKTFEAITRCRSGNAFFTHPTGRVKCLAASQKICYLAEDFFRKNQRRNRIDVRYITPHQTLFPVETYDDALVRITNQRNIYVWRRTNLVRVAPDENVAVFDCLDEPGAHVCLEYSLLHVTPPMSPPIELTSCSELVDSKGFVKVNPFTLQHENFPNVFAVGDCGSPRNSKTTSAISVQSPVVFGNIMACMEGKSPPMNYCGYSACPIITDYGKGILAEFDYSYEPRETFPCRQDVERAFVYYLKKDVLPQVYWRLLMKGRWNGPEALRSILEFLQ